MSIFRTIAMFLYLFGYMIVHYGTLRRGERALAAGDTETVEQLVDRHIPRWSRGILKVTGVTLTVEGLEIFLVYFCFNMLYHGTNVGVPLWVATVLNLLIFQMLFSYMWPQIALLDQPLSLTLKNSINCMIAFLPHALAASIVQILFWGVVILCMPLGLLLMLVFGFWFVTEVSCQIVYGDLDRVFHIEESIRKLKDAELEAALREDYAAAEDDTEK